MQQSKWTDAFVTEACNILASGDNSLTGSTIVKYMLPKSVVYDVDIPHAKFPFPEGSVPNKRTALLENVKAFKDAEQYEIIRELCDHEQVKENTKVQELRSLIVSRYGHIAKTQSPKIKVTNVPTSEHFLVKYPAALKVYSEGMTKYSQNIYERNALDDFRLSLELFLKILLNNNKSLENQIIDVSGFAKSKGISTEAVNMFNRLLNYYATYHNTYIKHNDNVNLVEMEFIIDQTNSFLKLLLK